MSIFWKIKEWAVRSSSIINRIYHSVYLYLYIYIYIEGSLCICIPQPPFSPNGHDYTPTLCCGGGGQDHEPHTHIFIDGLWWFLKIFRAIQYPVSWYNIYLLNKKWTTTLPETNIAPENWWLEYYFPFGARPIFRGELLALGRVYSSPWYLPCSTCMGIELGSGSEGGAFFWAARLQRRLDKSWGYKNWLKHAKTICQSLLKWIEK